MSKFIHTLNLIKANRSREWLTPTQLQALNALKEALQLTGTVNLCGSAGVGKTFLAWILVDELDFAYFPHITHFCHRNKVRVPGVIIDNVAPDRQSHRTVLKALEFEGVKHAVLITRELILDYTHYVELSLSSRDHDTVSQNLANVGIFISDSQVSKLWYLVNPNLRRS